MTAEAAVVLPTLVLVAGVLLWALAAAGAQIRCLDAARTAAREAARGEPAARVVADARAEAPAGAAVEVTPSGDTVRVTVRAYLALPGALRRHVGAVTVTATAVVVLEDSAPRTAGCATGTSPP